MKGKTIQVNVSAPTFQLKDIYDRQINLNLYQGRKVFIGFFRHAGCPFCNLRVHALTKRYEELKAKNLDMIFFFESTEKLLLQSIFHKEVSPIPLIADPERVMYTTYGIEQSVLKSTASHLTSFIQTAIKASQVGVPMHLMASGESFSTMPAEFLLDENLIIRKIHYSSSLNDRLSFQHLYDFADGKKE
ncbi:MAG: redoxin domain-containing protein [Cytophagaceae bacterium]|jgi:peroxiredoxin|nr:redoxin domain-containing protein [Cytophagaceae bacterium]